MQLIVTDYFKIKETILYKRKSKDNLILLQENEGSNLKFQAATVQILSLPLDQCKDKSDRILHKIK